MNQVLKYAIAGLMLVGLGFGLSQEIIARSMRGAFTNTKSLVQMSAPRALTINGFKESYSYALTLTDIYYNTKSQTNFGLVLASRSGEAADTISFAFSGPRSSLQSAIANTINLLMMSSLCVGTLEQHRSILNKNTEFFGQFLAAAQAGKAISLSKTYGAVRYQLSDMAFTGAQAKFTFTLSNPGQVGKAGWNEYCVVNDSAGRQ